MTETSILVVDDEAAERITLGEVLRLEGYRVALAASGEAALDLMEEEDPFDMLILDLRLPGMDGLQVLESVHEEHPHTIIILITGYATLETAIQALRHGAYDYLLKPCPVEDILETVRQGLGEVEKERHRQTLVERLQDTVRELVESENTPLAPERPADDDVLQVAGVLIDRAKHIVARGEERIDLTPTEFRLLECMMRQPDEVATPQELVRCAQGYEADPWGARSIIRVHIRRLRSKLEPVPSHPRYILNVRGVGYVFASTEVPEET
ncbi:MAG: response regulator transcription factor [Anaerolineales bacterium]